MALDINHTTNKALGEANNLSDLLNPNTALNNILPSQSGNNGKYLTTNGTNTSWATVSAGTTISGLAQNYLTKANATGDNIVNSLIYDNGINVGIGTTSPSYLLDVANTGHTRIAGGLILGASETGGYITSGDHKFQILGDNATQGLMTFIGGSGLLQVWKDTSPSIAWGYGMAVPGNPIEDDLIFSRWTPGWTEAFRIANATGYFGIGTSTPSAALHIGVASGQADVWIEGGGATRALYVTPTALGPGSELYITAGDGAGPGADGGNLSLSAGNSSTSNGGNVIINGGFGSAVGKINISTNGGFCTVGPSGNYSAQLHVYNTVGFEQFLMETPYTPTGNGDTNGSAGSVAWDDDYFYMKTVANGWGRIRWGFTF